MNTQDNSSWDGGVLVWLTGVLSFALAVIHPRIDKILERICLCFFHHFLTFLSHLSSLTFFFFLNATFVFF